MLPKEKINKFYKNPNTRAFYKEYNNKCNPEKLLNIAKKKIEIFEPLNSVKINHSFLIDISFKTKQYFIITNLNQYRKFIKLIKDSDKNNNNNCTDFLIYNRFVTKYTINNTKLINDNIISYEDSQKLFWRFIYFKSIIYDYSNNDLFILKKNIFIKEFIEFLNIYDYFYCNKNLLFTTGCIVYSFSKILKYNKTINYIINKKYFISE